MRHVRTWIQPESPQQALEVLRDRGPTAAFLGGGTLLAEQDDPCLETLIDLSTLGLDTIEASPTGLKVGAMTHLEALRRHPTMADLGEGILQEALGRTRIAAWRNQATLGGRLRHACRGDAIMTTLLVLDAHVEVLRHPAAPPEFLAIEEIPHLRYDDLILSVQIPRPVGWRHAAESVAQSAQDVPLCTLCAGVLLLDGRIRAIRIAHSGSSTTPQRLHAVEAALSGTRLEPETWIRGHEALGMEAVAQADDRAGSAYRAHLSHVLLGRVLRRVLGDLAA